MVVGQGELKVARVGQPPVQLQVPGLHIGVGVPLHRVLQPPLPAVVDAQQVLPGAERRVVVAHMEVVVGKTDAGKHLVDGNGPLDALVAERINRAVVPLHDRVRHRGKSRHIHPVFPLLCHRSTAS